MGGWLEFCNHYFKYFLKSKLRKVVLVPTSKGGSSFRNDWGTGMPTLVISIESTNLTMTSHPMNKMCGMIWYQGEGELE